MSVVGKPEAVSETHTADDAWDPAESRLLPEHETETNGNIVGHGPGLPITNGGLKKGPPTKYLADDGDGRGEEYKFGMGSCTPGWLQCIGSKQGFLITFCITWVLQGMFNTYFVSVITTIEKLFQVQSRTIGLVLTAVEIGSISSSLLITYYVGQGHRPRWIAWGMILFAICSLTCSLPHFIFGQDDSEASKVSLLTNVDLKNSSAAFIPSNICLDVKKTTDDIKITSLANSKECGSDFLAEQKTQSAITNVVLVMFYFSLLGIGMAQTPVYTLGIPYIDDNVASRESPLYFSITIGVRVLGPALGFVLGSICTRFYVNLMEDPKITPTDPQWVGAWWLGFVIVSGGLVLFSPTMFSFPKRLSTYRSVNPAPAPAPPAIKVKSVSESEKPREKGPSLRDFPKAINRLLRNDILMFRTASSVLHLLPIAGVYTFLPKYFETQFRLPAHDAAMVSGMGGIMVMGIGVILSGILILRAKPNPRSVAAWIAATAAIYSCGMIALMFIGCPMDDFLGLPKDNAPQLAPQCETPCGCDFTKFSPVCGENGLSYYSACHAGCHNLTVVDGKLGFSDCSCVKSGNGSLPTLSLQASPGYCHSECNTFPWYILLFSFIVFIHSTSEVGSMLLTLRCVDPRDKAMALGLIQFAIGLFGNVPCPTIYGSVVDSACLVWDKVCGQKGACSLYDSDQFRRFYHGTTAMIMMMAFFIDVIVWFKARSIDFAEENQAPETQEELSPISEKPRPETSV